MSQNVYAYQNVDQNTVMVDENNINFTGTWSSTGTYWADDRDAVVYGGANYIAIVDNVGGVPTYIPRRSQRNWSSLVLIRAGTTTYTAQEAYELAEQAIDDAAAAQATADLALAQTGTMTSDLAYLALQTAWSGTSGADSAFSIAVAGTQGVSTLFGWFGTLGTSDESAGSAYAFGLYVAGTNYTDDQVQNGSQFSVILHDQGTRYTDDQVRINHQQDGQYSFELYVAGTNYTNAQVVASSSGSALFWAGTDYTNAQVSIEAAARATNDDQVRVIANAGTNAAALALPLTGGTLSGNLRAPQLFLGSGTVPASSAINGTLYYDFLGPAFQETVYDRTLKIGAKNYTAGAEIAAILVSDGTQRPVTYSTEFSWFGTQIPHTSATATRKILVAMASAGTVPSKVVGATTAQI
jgi:hypothetical protein